MKVVKTVEVTVFSPPDGLGDGTDEKNEGAMAG